MATDFAALGLSIDATGMDQGLKKLDDVVAKSGQAEAAATRMQQTYGAAAKRMGMSVDEYVRHLDKQKGAQAQHNAALKASGEAARLTGYQYQQLGFQLNDIATSIASGGSPFRVLAQQGGQVYQALQMGPTGVGGSLRAIGGELTRLAASGPAAFLALGAAALGYVVTVQRAQAEQDKLEKQLAFGLGRFAGITSDGLRQITDAAAAATGVSRSVAREVAMTFAQTGQIGGEMFVGLIDVTKRYASVTGKEMGDAAKDIAKAFSDPAKGAEQMAAALGASTDFLSIKTRDHIKALVAQGEHTKAQGVLFTELASGPMPKLENRIKDLASLWERIKTAASDAGDAMVRAVVTTPADRSASLQQSLLGLNASPVYNTRRANMQKELAALYNDIDDLDARLWADQKARAAEGVAALEKAMADRANAHDLEVRAIQAKTEVQRAAIAGEEAYNRAIAAGMSAQQAKIEQTYAETRALEALKAGIDRTIQSYQDQANAASAGLNVLQSGGGMAAATAAMEKYSQLANLQREIDAADAATKPALIERYNQLASAIDKNTQARAALQAAQSAEALKDEAEILRIRINMWGEENALIEKAIALKQVEQQIRAAGATGAEAAAWRARAEEVANLKIALDQLNQTAKDGSGAADRLGSAWEKAGQQIEGLKAAAIGAGSALQTLFAGAWAGGGGAGTATIQVMTPAWLSAMAKKDATAAAKSGSSDGTSALQRTIDALERNIDRVTNARMNYNPDPYSEKNPLVFYDPNSGKHFTEAEKRQIAQWEKEIAIAEKQLAELEKLNAKKEQAANSNLPEFIHSKEAMQWLSSDPQASYVLGSNYQKGIGPDGHVGYVRKFATGGSLMIGGMGGADNNVLSLNGLPIGRVSRGERLDIVPQDRAREPANSNSKGGTTIIHNTYQVNVPAGAVQPRGNEDPRIAARRVADLIGDHLARRAR